MVSHWLSVCLSVCPSVCRTSLRPYFRFWECQWICTKLCVCIDIVELWFWIANGQILTELSARNTFLSFRTISWLNLNGFSPNLICALILWNPGLGSLMGKFRQFLTELSARDMIMTGNFRFTFLLLSLLLSKKIKLDITCESSAWQMIHMKCQGLFSQIIIKIIIIIIIVIINK